MKCKNIRTQLLDYSKGNLKAEQTTAIREHLEECEACRLFLAEEVTLSNMLGQFPAEQPSCSAWSSIESRLAVQNTGIFAQFGSVLQNKFITATSALLVAVALFAVITLHHNTPVPINDIQPTLANHQSSFNSYIKWMDDPASAGSDMIVQFVDNM